MRGVASPDLFTVSGAVFSPCARYRYLLWRSWDAGKSQVLFVMLNPSTADAERNDPTVERCQRRAHAMGFGGVLVANLFALRSTDPAALYAVHDPIGPDNNRAIRDAARGAALVVCAWGDHGALGGRGAAVRALLERHGHALYVLGLNRGGAPKHPLYVSYARGPQPWGPPTGPGGRPRLGAVTAP